MANSFKLGFQDNQLLHWPKFSKFNHHWKFEISYDILLQDGENHSFQTHFDFHTMKGQIYYCHLTEIIPFDMINWDWRKDVDDNGKHLNFSNLKNFIFKNTKYTGHLALEDHLRTKVFSNGHNPLKWSDKNDSDEMAQNRDAMASWWLIHHGDIVKEILQNKDEFNSKLIEAAQAVLIQNRI
ncbi:MAG TPA: hypothetical protein DCF84_01080 [Bacteroidetes bacterium]|nr:hypothetical protein [Bacteroidota bacterium]